MTPTTPTTPTTTTTTTTASSLQWEGSSFRGRLSHQQRPKHGALSRRTLLETNGSTTGLSNGPHHVFLLGDTYEPDIVSLLLKQAGDVESNPGPEQCKDCGTVFSAMSKPVQCSEFGEKFYKVAKKGQPTTCSGQVEVRRYLEKGEIISLSNM